MDEIEVEMDTEDLWKKVKGTILEAAEMHIPKKKKRTTTPWLSREAISVAEERRAAKDAGDKVKVRILNRVFQKQAREDKGKHLNEMCRVMEDEGKKGRIKEMFAKVK